jgi:hypothetical protein
MATPISFRPTWSNFFFCLLRSPTMGALLASNVLILLIIPINKANAVNLIWVYWMQSVMIGFLHFIKMLVYQFKPPEKGLPPNDISTWPRLGAGLFFLFHYGFFHVAYVFFIGSPGIDWNMVFKASSIFAGQMFLGAIFHYRDESGKTEMGKFFMKPYVRIIPIHIAIILGGILGSVGIFLFLIVFKTAMELGIEYFEINGASLVEWSLENAKEMEKKGSP